MPWPKLEDVPASIRKHKDIPLSHEQANKWGEIFDALKTSQNVNEPAAAAWSTWEEIYEVKDGSWVKRKREAAESMLYVEEQTFAESVEGSVLEKDKDGLPSKIKVMVIQEGAALTKGRVYPKEPLKKLASSGMLDNLKMYDQHADGSEKIAGAIYKPRSMRDYLSYILPGTAKFEEGIKTKAGKLVNGITATVKLIDRDFKYKVSEAAETMGLSLSGLLDAMRSKTGEDIVQDIRRVVSLDWLTGEPNCGGQVLEFVEAADPDGGKDSINNIGKEETKQMEWKDITAEELKKNRPDLVGALNTEAQAGVAAAETAQKAAETKATEAEATATAATAEKDKAVAEAAEVKKQLDAKTKEFAEQSAKTIGAEMAVKTIEAVESKCASLNILARAQVMKAVLGKGLKTEQEVAEAIDAEVKNLPKPSTKPASGSAGGSGDKPTLSAGSAEFAESIGLDEQQRERLAQVR